MAGDPDKVATEATFGPNHGEHGMLVFGGRRLPGSRRAPVYASHLPMFMDPHRFQVIMAVGGPSVETLLAAGPLLGESEVFTFQPELFSIDELDPHHAGTVRESFAGTLFHGHFERDGSALEQSGGLTVAAMVLFEEFRRDVHRGGPLRYLCFGTPEATYLAHLITAPPDFDQILTVALAKPGPPPELLRRGIRLELHGRANDFEHRLIAGEQVSMSPSAGGAEVVITVTHEIYLETDDLAVAG